MQLNVSMMTHPTGATQRQDKAEQGNPLGVEQTFYQQLQT